MIVYFDTSALVKAYVAEDSSDAVGVILASPDLQAGSLCLLEVEMAAALGKAVRLLRLDETVQERAWQNFLEDWSAFAQIEVSVALVHRAARLAIERSLRGYDALHLAAALAWREYLSEPVTLATFDRDLWQAARDSGLTPWPKDLDNRAK